MEQGAHIRVYGYLQRNSMPVSTHAKYPFGYTFHIEDAALMAHATRAYTTSGSIVPPPEPPILIA
jgi:hypothetical protein